MEYINIDNIKKFIIIEIVDITSAPSTEIILGKGLRVKRILLGLNCNESFINGNKVSISLSFFDINWSLRDLFSLLNLITLKTICYLMILFLFLYILFYNFLNLNSYLLISI